MTWQRNRLTVGDTLWTGSAIIPLHHTEASLKCGKYKQRHAKLQVCQCAEQSKVAMVTTTVWHDEELTLAASMSATMMLAAGPAPMLTVKLAGLQCTQLGWSIYVDMHKPLACLTAGPAEQADLLTLVHRFGMSKR